MPWSAFSSVHHSRHFQRALRFPPHYCILPKWSITAILLYGTFAEQFTNVNHDTSSRVISTCHAIFLVVCTWGQDFFCSFVCFKVSRSGPCFTALEEGGFHMSPRLSFFLNTCFDYLSFVLVPVGESIKWSSARRVMLWPTHLTEYEPKPLIEISSEHTPTNLFWRKGSLDKSFDYHATTVDAPEVNDTTDVGRLISPFHWVRWKFFPIQCFLFQLKLKTGEIQANLRETVVERWKKVRFGVIETLKGKWKGFAVRNETASILLWKACRNSIPDKIIEHVQMESAKCSYLSWFRWQQTLLTKSRAPLKQRRAQQFAWADAPQHWLEPWTSTRQRRRHRKTVSRKTDTSLPTTHFTQ